MTRSPYPKHVFVDEATHFVIKVDVHDDGPHHTHRVHLACGMSIDVDIGGVRRHKRHLERAGQHHDPAWKKKHAEIAEDALAVGESWDDKRWRNHENVSTCEHCRAVEMEGEKPITHENAHTKPNTRHADVATGLPCPMCGSELRIRPDKSVGCAAHGHNFNVPEVLTTGMGLLHKLAEMAKGKE